MTDLTQLGSAKRDYKDTLFRKIFNDSGKLLDLYNAVNNTRYENPDDLRINTLDNAIYLNMKNDISFILDFHLSLYEHQSTPNPSMPLRNLFYIARLFEAEIDTRSLYASVAPGIPFPTFVVFYNGTAEQPEQDIIRLSDLYQQMPTLPKLELEVLLLNINYGKNQILMEQCQTLKEYALYVDKVRTYALQMKIKEAVELAVAESINEDILADFLTRYRAEAIQLSIFEYDEEKELEKLRRVERQAGETEGHAKGLAEGRTEGYVFTVRHNYGNGKSSSEITEILGLNKTFVEDVIELLNHNPKLSNLEIAKLLSSNNTLETE